MRLTDEERKSLIEFYFTKRYHAPIFRAHSDEEKRQLCEQFLATIQKVPVFWYYVEYEPGMMRDSLYRWATIVYSDGDSIREMQVARDDISVTITDQCESFALIERSQEVYEIRSIVFNPHSQW
ncbi:MAG: hypothetical protein ACM3ZQ_07745 [Bacillota bacterium]